MMTNEGDEKGLDLENRIEKFMGQLSGVHIKRIEYNPQSAVFLLDMPSGYREQGNSVIM